MELGLAGKTALVTGASRGIGLAIVRALAEEGVKVAACARNTNSALAETGAIFVPADLSTPDGVNEGVNGALAALGELDILVNNVGGGSPELMGSFLELDDAKWVAGFRLNFFATLRVIRLAMPSLLRTKGTIVNISSIAARLPADAPVHYSTPKAALNALSKSLDVEFGPQGVRVNTVSPGPTRTDLWVAPDGAGAAMAKAQGITHEQLIAGMAQASGLTTGRIAEPEEVARVVAFLASPASGSIAGADYLVDGGAVKAI